MKRITVVLDGIADRPQAELGGATPMEAAKTPGLDALFTASRPGTVLTIKPGQEIGSSVANLSLLGYDAGKVYTGRAVIEAAGAGIGVKRENLYIRCNFVAFKGDDFDSSVLASYNAHDIGTDEARALADMLNREVFRPPFRLEHIDTFRSILIVEGAADMAEKLGFVPAHEMIGGRVSDNIKDSAETGIFAELMREAYGALRKRGGSKANGVWFWGASRAPEFGDAPEEKRAILAETSLMRGIAALSGTKCVSTPENNGFVRYLEDKAKDASAAVAENDFTYIHIQKLDDLSHELLPARKAEAIERIDEFFIRPFFAGLKEPYCAVVASDHYTFSDSGGHGAEPAPFMLLGRGGAGAKGRFTERCCRESGLFVTAEELNAMQRG